MPRAPLAVAAVLALALACVPAQAETAGPYVHGVAREDDGKLVVCFERTLAVRLAWVVNGALLELRGELEAAPDAAARQRIYATKLFPGAGWGQLMEAVEAGRCELVTSADHTSRATILLGPAELVPLGAAHHVVESELIHGDTGVPVTVWLLTTEAVPPPEP